MLKEMVFLFSTKNLKFKARAKSINTSFYSRTLLSFVFFLINHPKTFCDPSRGPDPWVGNHCTSIHNCRSYEIIKVAHFQSFSFTMAAFTLIHQYWQSRRSSTFTVDLEMHLLIILGLLVISKTAEYTIKWLPQPLRLSWSPLPDWIKSKFTPTTLNFSLWSKVIHMSQDSV